MSAVWMRARAELRARWRAALGLALLVGIAGGAVMAAVAGARRTDSAHPRFLAATRAFDVGVPEPFFEGVADLDLDRVAALPQVLESARLQFFSTDRGVDILVSPDGRATTAVAAMRIIEGRAADPRSPDEIVAPPELAARFHFRVGSRLPLRLQISGREGGRPVYGPPSDFRVVGIGLTHTDFPPHQSLGTELYGTPSLYRMAAGRHEHLGGVILRLRRGPADIPALNRELERLAGGKTYFAITTAAQNANVQRAIHMLAVALWLLAGLAGTAGLLILAQTLARQIFLESADHPTLQALGMSRAQLWAVGMARSALVAAAGAALAVALAVALSPLTPIGLARLADPDPGVSIDATVLGAGVAAIVVLVLALAAVPAWRIARAVGRDARPSGARPSKVAGSLARAGFPPTGVSGVRLALEAGRGTSAVPVRSTLAGVTLGVVALATALGFGASLTHLFRSPRLYGWTWDARLFASGTTEQIASVLSADPRIDVFSDGGTDVPIQIRGRTIEGMTIDPERLSPPIIRGRAPRGPGADREIVFGTQTLRALHLRLGETVSVQVPGKGASAQQMRIVGTAVFPPVSDTTALGRGALITNGAVRLLIPEVETFQDEGASFYIRYKRGVDVRAALADLKRRLAESEVSGRTAPRDLINFGQVDNVPIALGGGVAAVAAATLAHTLVTSVRRRRRDLAILKTLGFSRGQVGRTVAWQATTIVSIALAVGLPVGTAAGRWAWRLFADRLGIVPEPIVPALALLLIVPAALVLANLIAWLPARAAARTRPALVLRTE